MRAYERLLRYVTVYTMSDEASGTVPSTARQFDLARLLADEMKEMGIRDAHVDDKSYVYGWIDATPGYEQVPAIGFIAHLDTAPAFAGENVKPQIHENYDGKALPLGAGLTLDPQVFPHLPSLAGKTLITTDGTTLLGADDKAGIAEILTLAEKLLREDIPHGRICLAFTPDEEIGGGAEDLDLEKFGAAFGYTVDGGAENELSYENFNACEARFTIRGRSVHPGDAKNTMINAATLACEINNALPAFETPADTEGYEGFYYLEEIQADTEKAQMVYIVRDHSAEVFASRQRLLRHIEKLMNEKYGEGTVSLTIREQYRNMLEQIRPCMEVVDAARAAIEAAGLTVDVSPIRGGTDGAQLSYRGLPCPNLGTGGYAFHGPYEHITVEGMDKVVEVLEGIVRQVCAQ